MRHLLMFCLLIGLTASEAWPGDLVTLSASMFDGQNKIALADSPGWVFKVGHDPSWASADYDDSQWSEFAPIEINSDMADESGRLEGWFRLRIRLDSSFQGVPVGMVQRAWAATDIYVDGELIHSFGNTGRNGEPYQGYDRITYRSNPLPLVAGQDHLVAIHFVDYTGLPINRLKSQVFVLPGFFNLTGPDYDLVTANTKSEWGIYTSAVAAILGLLSLLFWLLFVLNRDQEQLLFMAISVTMMGVAIGHGILGREQGHSFYIQRLYDMTFALANAVNFMSLTLLFSLIFQNKIFKWHLWLVVFTLVYFLVGNIYDFPYADIPVFFLAPAYIGICVKFVVTAQNKIDRSQWVVVIGILGPIAIHTYFLLFQGGQISILLTYAYIAFALSLMIYVILQFNKMVGEIQQSADALVLAAREKEQILSGQKEELERQVEERTKDLSSSLDQLKSTQTQLIHSEKMASLGELTAGIAHEIQNPLNFVNNFSDINKELIDELREAQARGDQEEVEAITRDLQENEEKITHHGKRAEEIVRSMLLHSRGSEGVKELTDLNALCDEYLRLAYHGFRAKDQSFNCEYKLEFDPDLPKLEVVPQDIGRVLLNLINNAFQAVNTPRPPEGGTATQPLVVVTTRAVGSPSGDKGAAAGVEIHVSDNGPGIPDEIKDKIFQPFFTTKETGKGTGLGLSLSYDIVTKGHGGKLNVVSENGQGSTFIIHLTVNS